MSLGFEDMEDARKQVNEELQIDSRLHRVNDNEVLFIGGDETVARLVKDNDGIRLEYV